MKGLGSIKVLTSLLLLTVTDSSGASIAGAKVTLTETNTQIIKIGESNGSGAYAFPGIPPGRYSTGGGRAVQLGAKVVF